MKGLLLKSWKNVLPMLAYYVFFFVVFFIVSAVNRDPLYFAAVSVAFAVAVPLAAMSRDETDGWDAFAVAAGVSRGKLAVSRYLFSLFCIVPAWLASVVLIFLAEDRLEAVATVLLFMGAGMIAAAVLMPLCFRFGIEKSRVLLIVVLLLIFAAAFAVGVLLFGEDLGVSWNLPLFVLPCVVLGAGVLAVAASLLIGIRILQTKDL